MGIPIGIVGILGKGYGKRGKGTVKGERRVRMDRNGLS